MNILETLRLVYAAFRTNKLRTFLTLLGVIIGVTTVITVVSLIKGMNRYVVSTLTQAGSNVFRIDRFGIITSQDAFEAAMKRKDLTLEDMDIVKKSCNLCSNVGAFAVMPSFLHQVSIDVTAGREKIEDPRVLGVTANFAFITNREIGTGRHITEWEVDHTASSTVLGYEVAHSLFPQLDPIGKSIHINNRKFTVVGVLKKYGNFLGENRDIVLEIPITSFQKIFGKHDSVFVIVKVERRHEDGPGPGPGARGFALETPPPLPG